MRMGIKKRTFLEALAGSIDVFGGSNHIELIDDVSPIKRTFGDRKRPSQQDFNEVLREGFQSAGDNIRWALVEYKKRTG